MVRVLWIHDTGASLPIPRKCATFDSVVVLPNRIITLRAGIRLLRGFETTARAARRASKGPIRGLRVERGGERSFG